MKKRLLLILLSLILLTIALVFRIARYYSLSCNIYANTGIKGEVYNRANETIIEILDNYQFEDIVNVVYTISGDISDIKVNTAKLNTFATTVSAKIYSNINESGNTFGLPIGNVLGFKYLSGKGPKIPIRVHPITAVTHNIYSELLESGINQTLHRVIIEFKAEINCVAPFKSNKIEFNIKLIMAETLIVGKIPQLLLPTS
ncbi:MAG: sporulation protein YunB [Clostridia bacterium]|nr:sporulation protein YunB [Clostridia bacterium]